jgi:hypothetical protein
MRTEEEVREMYRQYVYRYAIADLNGQRMSANQYFGASVACGRTLGRNMKRINKDFGIAKNFIKRTREEGKTLPGFKAV